jgi:hypothetical protein
MSQGHGNKLAFEQELREEREAICLLSLKTSHSVCSWEHQEKIGEDLGPEWILPFLSFLLFER